MNSSNDSQSPEASELLGFAQEIEVDYSRSPSRPLFSAEDLERFVTELKEIFRHDASAVAQKALETWRAHAAAAGIGELFWFQRIALGNDGVTTTSDHTLYSGDNPGPLNTLWGRLTPMEGATLRPLPKWAYLQRILPPMRGKTVLEIGTACGFWPLKFAQLGASFCSGIEVVPELVAQARSVAKTNPNEDKVHFVLGDAYLDPSVPQHDIVFMSEVLIHSIFPDFSLLRSLNLAKEWLVIDDFFSRSDSAPAMLRLMRDFRTGKISWTGFSMTEKLLFQFLYAYGVEPSRVARYHDPMGEHAVFVIDTRGVAEFRRKVIGHESLFSSLRASMLHRSYDESLRNGPKALRAPKLIES
jgi:Protein of unknown function (DUF1698)